MEKIRVFVDMDGTLFKWNEVPFYERLFEKGYFENLEPIPTVVNAINDYLKGNDKQLEFYTLSAFLDASPYALKEKNASLDKHLPDIPATRRLFVPMGSDKADYVPNGIKSTDVLLDDYTLNLDAWKDKGGVGVKLLNGINDTNHSWNGFRIDSRLDPTLFFYQLKYFAFSSIQRLGIKDRMLLANKENSSSDQKQKEVKRDAKRNRERNVK